MRTSLPSTRANGHAPVPERVFVISGMCQDPHFRLHFGPGSEADFCLIYLGAPGLGETGAAEMEASGGEPYFVLRRLLEDGAVAVIARVDWEGIFTILANDDDSAELLFADLVAPGEPEEVDRRWSDDPAALRMFAELLQLH